jgi:hypothetical protein
VWGQETKTGPWVVYRLGKNGRREKLYEKGGEKLTAVLGRGDILYVALKGRLLKLDQRASPPVETVMQFKTPINTLTWVEGAGLVYEANKRIFLHGGDFLPLPVMDCENCRMQGHGEDLYVMLRKPGGILKITGLSQLKKAVKK